MCSALKFKTKRRRVGKENEKTQADIRQKKPPAGAGMWKCKLASPVVEEVNDFALQYVSVPARGLRKAREGEY